MLAASKRLALEAVLRNWEHRLATQDSRSPGTVRQYRRAVLLCEQYLRNHCREHAPDGLLTAAPDGLTAALDQWAEHWRIRYDLGDVKADAVRTAFYGVRAFYRYAVETKALAHDPTAALVPPKQPKRLPRPKDVTLVQRLVQSAPTLRDQLLVSCAFHGLRNIEICRLRTDSLELDRTLRKAALRVDGKGDKPRQVFLNGEVTPWLAEYLVQRLAADLKESWWAQCDPAWDDTERWLQLAEWTLERRCDTPQPLFLTDTNTPISQRWLNRRFLALNDGVGARGNSVVRPHALRHTCATQLLDNGADIRQVQEVLGHANIRTTELYTYVSRTRQAITMDRLPRLGVPLTPAEAV